MFHQDQPSPVTYMQQPQPNNNFNPQPSFNTNYMQQPMPNPEDIIDPTTAMNMALVLMANAFKRNYSTPTNKNQRISSNPRNRQIANPGMNLGQVRHIQMVGVQNLGIQNVGNQNRLIVVAGIVNQNLNSNENGIQTDNAPVYDSDGSAKFLVWNKVGETVEQHPAIAEETRALCDSLYNNLATKVETVNSVNCNLKETNADLTTELARYKNQEKCFEINQEKYDKLERCYQNSVYQEQCLTKKINALHLSSAKTIMNLNEKIANLNNQLSKEKSTVSSLQEEKKNLKYDFKICEDELLDKQIQLENKIKELDNILVKTGQSIQLIHMLSPKPDSFYHTEQKMALGYQNPFYLKQARHKQQSLYNGKVLLEKHDPPAVYDSEETLVVVSQDIMSIVQNNSVVDTLNLQTELDRTKEKLESCIIKKEKEYAVLWNNCSNIQCASNTLDPLSQKLEDENVSLEFQLFDKVSEQKNTTKGTSVDAKFSKQSILGKPPSSSFGPKLYSVTHLPKSKVILKVGELNALSKPVTSNSVPSSQESIVVNNERVIAPGIFRINPSKASRVNNFVPNKHVNTSSRTKPITVSQPHVIIKKDVNSNTNGFSPKDVESTTRTRRPQPRNNLKNDKVLSKSKSSYLSNNLDKIEENHRTLQSSTNQKHTSSACNNIKLVVRNKKSEVICATCKQCLITDNHDECVLQYVNNIKSRQKNQRANVSKSATKKKHKANVKKSKKLGSKDRLASSRPSKPITCLK
ncbi:hypothetical protein Tco_0213085 [Tanacetum coccineum]